MYHRRPPSTTKIIVILFFLCFTISESFVVDEIVKQTSLTYRLLNWAKTLFSPDLDFRARISNDQPPTTEGGAADKVKEAVAKGKASVEESAKSAADITKEKLKETFTPRHEL